MIDSLIELVELLWKGAQKRRVEVTQYVKLRVKLFEKWGRVLMPHTPWNAYLFHFSLKNASYTLLTVLHPMYITK